MSFFTWLFTELRRLINNQLDMGSRHALARTCHLLLAEDGGAATRLPPAWLEKLRTEKHYLNLAVPRRDMFWQLHALGIGNWVCAEPWNYRIYTHGGGRSSLLYVEMTLGPRAHLPEIIFRAEWIIEDWAPPGGVLGGCTELKLKMQLPVPRLFWVPAIEWYEWKLTDPFDTDRSWLLDCAHRIACTVV